MFDDGWSNDTQLLQWVMSYDGVHEPEPLAITAAAAALLISGTMPWLGLTRIDIAPTAGQSAFGCMYRSP